MATSEDSTCYGWDNVRHHELYLRQNVNNNGSIQNWSTSVFSIEWPLEGARRRLNRLKRSNRHVAGDEGRQFTHVGQQAWAAGMAEGALNIGESSGVGTLSWRIRQCRR